MANEKERFIRFVSLSSNHIFDYLPAAIASAHSF